MEFQNMNHSIFTSKFLTIDIDEGIERLGGNKDIYIEILNDFQKNNHPIFQQFSEKIQKRQWDKAKLLSHALKGSAGNLALIQLYQVSIELDLAVKNQQIEQITQLLPLFEQALNETFTTIKKIVLENKPTELNISNNLNNEELKTLLFDFNQQLNFQNIDALGTFKELKAYFNQNEYTVELNKISDSLNQFDFETALEIFKKLNLFS